MDKIKKQHTDCHSAADSKPTITSDPITDASSLYHPIEHAILAAYLKRSDLLPETATGIDPRTTVDPKSWNEKTWGIGANKGLHDQYLIENAVARICLSDVQDELPQWFSSDGHGNIIFGREIRPSVERRFGILHPELLFMLNWASTAPGISWPESFYVTYLPYYKVYVVTVSSDTNDAYGYPDIAIGFGASNIPVQETIRKTITSWWVDNAPNNPGGWEEFQIEGEVDEGTAYQWLKNALARRRRKAIKENQSMSKDNSDSQDAYRIKGKFGKPEDPELQDLFILFNQHPEQNKKVQ